MQTTFHEIHQALGSGRELAVAAIITDRGSTPRHSGSKMIVYPDGAISGTIGGGAVEGDVIRRAVKRMGLHGAEIASYDLNREANIERMDLICGGRIQVLIEHVPVSAANVDLYQRAREEIDKGRPFWWIGKLTGDNRQLTVERTVHGSPDEFGEALRCQPECRQRLESDLRIAGGSCFIQCADQAYVIESIQPAPCLFLIGAGHVSREIGALCPRVGLRTVVFDDRVEFANAARFPDADKIEVCPGFTEVFDGFHPRPDDFIVIVTRGHRFDKEVLVQALKTGAGYIGMIGSRRKRDTIYRELIAQGIAPAALAEVHCPVGLPIDAEAPAEIAVSVVAQLIQHRARRRNHEAY
jgi:xanthine dehydrogenase accessory factor